ncbi:MAG: sirohydrochlorin cobaltochelatase [Clostridiales bacterium]|jgi:sirohydrochlorin cobaltochelatase|nr:sirohydrochlorin cobaltochelatase [Clostridiales bacterium]
MNIYLIGAGDISALAADAAERFPESAVWAAKALPKGIEFTDNHIVQPVYLLPGIKYEQLLREALAYSGGVTLGEPLLRDEAAVNRLAGILSAEYGNQNALFVGHGTNHSSGRLYRELGEALRRESGGRFFLSVLDEDFTAAREWIAENKIDKTLLVPLMISMGRHAENEIIGRGGESIRSRLEAAGVETVCVAKGLIDYPAVREVFIDNIASQLKSALLADF